MVKLLRNQKDTLNKCIYLIKSIQESKLILGGGGDASLDTIKTPYSH